MVMNLLKGFRGQQKTSILVALSLHQSRFQIIVLQFEVRVAPTAIYTQHTRHGTLVEL